MNQLVLLKPTYSKYKHRNVCVNCGRIAKFQDHKCQFNRPDLNPLARKPKQFQDENTQSRHYQRKISIKRQNNIIKYHQQKKKIRDYHKQQSPEKKAGDRLRRSITRKRERDAIAKYLGGWRCNVCGYDENESALEFDHIHNTGRKDRMMLGPRTLLRFYYNRPLLARKVLQVLCCNCNKIKQLKRQIPNKDYDGAIILPKNRVRDLVTNARYVY